ncbi:50S ribosomal protein L6 [Candidatus Nomurabacteria bacterium RIFCSPLOWO2_01_FULL_33_24]|uniref:50S ribosomal protein L6 n=1 Tax=Candidatus Nomurabacteria bacterium RIFCSPLOWO2_01_FULL_33_24 TaxID=1801765 RepID=A0A1F6X235_9BACT|nr:MAG: 50S ribosomal protein L6 [Candidatus Nomurabacteria bacterium RIFCSPLOWO2_01_FULL_33_24]
MSRIGKQEINIPNGTEVAKNDNLLIVKGPKGELKKEFKDIIDINIKDKIITLKPRVNNIASKALWGTYASHIKNMVDGVNNLFEKKLIVEGIGFKTEINDHKLVLSVGFSHKINISLPKNLNVSVQKNIITISGVDKELVGQFSAKIRSLKKPEPYKGKGIRYENEIIRRKQGKRAVT